MATEEQLKEIAKCEKELKALATKLRNVYLDADIQSGFYLYNKRVRSKTDKIAWDIFHKQEELNRLRKKCGVSKDDISN